MLFFVLNFLDYLRHIKTDCLPMSMRYIYFIIIFFQSCFTLVKAESSDSLTLNYPYINYTTKDGLPSNETYCVLQDSRGYIWIGTDRGLVKYDGYEFKTYTTLDGLTDNVILAINEDDKGNIWYTGLNTLELGYIDSQMNFHTYKYNEQLKEVVGKLEYPIIYFNDIYIKGDYIYLVNRFFGYLRLDSKGVFEYDIRVNDREHLRTETKYVREEEFKFIYSYFGTIEAIKRPVSIINTKGERVFTYIKNRFRDISPSILQEDSICYIYDGEDYIQLKDSVLNYQRLPYICFAFQIDSDAYVYSTYGYNDLNGKVYYSKSPDINDTKVQLIPDDVRVIKAIKDQKGGIWIATLRNGIFYIPYLNSKFSILNEPIEVLYSTKEGLFLMNKKEERFFDFQKELLVDTISNFSYLSLNSPSNKFSFFGRLNIDVNLSVLGKTQNTIGAKGLHILSDTLQYIWTSGYNLKIKNRIIEYNHISKTYKKLPKQESLFCFKEDSCLFGTQNGVYLYTGDTIIDLNKQKKKRIRQIEFFKESNILVYSIWGEGIVLEYENGRNVNLSHKNGLVSNMVSSFYMDTTETLWMGTNKGVQKLSIDSKTQKHKIKTISNGAKNLSSPNILQVYYQDSMLYLGTDSGFDMVDLRSKEGEVGLMPLRIDSVQINETKYTISKSPISLSYDSNNVTMYYTAVAFNMFNRVNYRYRLKGLSNTWIYTKERKVSFQQLNPGTYSFELEAQDEYGKWIDIENNPEFVIDKPYWKTWWFIGGGILIGFLIIGGVLYYYISNLRRENELLENEKKLSSELNESQQKALSAQLNPHFVFNSLNSIQNFILTQRTELSSDYLSMFSKLMRFIFENSKQLYVALADEIEALKLYLELEKVRHNHKFRYQINYKELPLREIFIPALLVQPIIENAIWHGLLHKKSNDRLLEINFSSTNNHLKIEVIDNGAGRGSSRPRPKYIKKQKSSGVELTKQRLSLLSQSIELETHFEIIDLFNEQNQPAGTKVSITIPIIREQGNKI